MSTNAWEWEEGFAEGRKAGLEEAAKCIEEFFSNKHTCASENSDRYQIQDETVVVLANAIRSLANQQAKDEKGEG